MARFVELEGVTIDVTEIAIVYPPSAEGVIVILKGGGKAQISAAGRDKAVTLHKALLTEMSKG